MLSSLTSPGLNPNVMFELGMAHGLGKPLVLLLERRKQPAPARKQHPVVRYVDTWSRIEYAPAHNKPLIFQAKPESYPQENSGLVLAKESQRVRRCARCDIDDPRTSQVETTDAQTTSDPT